jgi:hypothetical protein
MELITVPIPLRQKVAVPTVPVPVPQDCQNGDVLHPIVSLPQDSEGIFLKCLNRNVTKNICRQYLSLWLLAFFIFLLLLLLSRYNNS